MYYCPALLSDAWAFLDAQHRPMTVFVTSVPLSIIVIDIPRDHPATFKARTYADRIEVTLWFIQDNPSYIFQAFTLTHELLHQMCDHCTLLHTWQSAGEITGRLRNGSAVTYPYDEVTAQHALDYCVNDGAVRMKLPKPPSEIFLHNPVLFGGWLDAEQDIYVRLYEHYYPPQMQPQAKPKPTAGQGQGQGAPQPGSLSGNPGQGQPTPDRTSSRPVPGPSHPANNPKEPGLGSGEFDVVASDPGEEVAGRVERRRGAIRQAFAPENTDKLIGHSPGDIEALVNKVYPADVAWWDYVKPRFMSYCEGYVKSWASPDLLWWSMGYSRPSRVSPRAGYIVFAVDTSGSINAKERAHYIGHLQSFAEEAMPMQLILLEVDRIVQRVTYIHEPQELSDFLEPMITADAGFIGGGGTDMRKIDAWLRENDVRPDMTIILTDGMTPWPTNEGNSAEVLWVSTTHREAPEAAGKTIRMKMAE